MISLKKKRICSLQSVWLLRYNCFMKIDVAHIAKLANLPLSDNEKKKFEKQLSAVLGHFKKLSEVATDEIKETSNVAGLTNISRTDESKASLNQKEALSNAPKTYNGNFVVPVILEEAME